MAKKSLFRTYVFLTGKYAGSEFKVYYSDHPVKKYEVDVPGKTVLHGAKNYKIAPGTQKGMNYCSRSLGIGNLDTIYSANFWSRLNWNCEGSQTTTSTVIKTKVGTVRIKK